MICCNNCHSPTPRFQCGDCGEAFFCNASCQRAENGEHYADEIIPGLWLGSICAVRSGKFDEFAIISIMNQHDLDKITPRKHHLKLPMDDAVNEPIENYFDVSFKFIEKHINSKKMSVLVHCHAGHSRSTTLVAHYLMKQGICGTAYETLDYISKKRPAIGPNKGFIKKLRLFE